MHTALLHRAEVFPFSAVLCCERSVQCLLTCGTPLVQSNKGSRHHYNYYYYNRTKQENGTAHDG